jgi:hypothetical protein
MTDEHADAALTAIPAEVTKASLAGAGVLTAAVQLQERVRSGEPGLFFILCPRLTAVRRLCGEHLDAALFVPDGHAACPACGSEISFDVSRMTISVS